MEDTKTKVVIYLRVSSDPDGHEASITRHRDDCHALCQRHGWQVVEECVDNDISASRYSRKKRPGWARVLELIESGAANRIVAWDLDRMLRQPRELEDLIDRADNGLPVTTISGDVRLDTADGRFITRILVAKAAKESDDLSRRIRRAREEAAAKGRVNVGIVAFGWTDNGHTIVEDEAEAIRDGARRLLANEINLAGLAREWTAKGFRRVRGGHEWTTTTIRDVMLGPRNAGLLKFRGKVIGEAAWPPIIDRVTHERLVRKFNERKERTTPRRITTFTGVFKCGNCHKPLTIDRSGPRQVFRCKASLGHQNCGKLAIAASGITDNVLEYLFHSVDSNQVRLPDDNQADMLKAVNELKLVEERMGELSGMFARQEVTSGEWRTARDILAERIKDLTRTINGQQGSDRVRERFTTPGLLRESWSSLTVYEQNSILREVFDGVIVRPAEKGCRGADRLEFVCRK